jgi:molybdopterin synthase catalytic subunit
MLAACGRTGILISMRIRVLVFGVLRESISPQEQVFELGPEATALSVIEHYRSVAPAVGNLWNSVAIAVNGQYAPVSLRLTDGDEVALLPPVSGGSADPASVEPGEEQVWITHEPIASSQVIDNIKSGPDGAMVAFDGIVRNNTRGRQTLFLFYEAYEAMALTQMRTLRAEALERFAVRDVALVHRLGRLSIGESSVLIVVAAAHRGAAFEACRWLIDTLKKTVPIWKREHFVDGAVWAAGEPFPAEIAAAPAESRP